MCALLILSLDFDVKAVERKRDRRVEKKTIELSDYEKLFQGKKVQTFESDFLTIHKEGRDVLVEYPLKYLGRSMLIAGTITTSSNADLFVNGYKVHEPLCVDFALRDSGLLEMRQINAKISVPNKNGRMKNLVNQNFGAPIMKKYKVLAYTPDSLAVVVNMTDLFMDKEKALSPIPKGNDNLQIAASFNKNLSSIQGIKVFENNISVVTELVYKYTLKRDNRQIFKDKPLTVTMTRSVLLLPDEKMRPRLSDSRIGTFLTFKQKLSETGKPIEVFTYANRWRLEPKDEEAYRNGELTIPQKPIVFYLDTLFPEAWKRPIREGILRWNRAFEKIGFKDAIQVRDFPSNDHFFDADNLKYSCIRYVPTAVANAMGPSWVDPSTGEILNASVFVYNNIVEMLYGWRFVQTAQVDTAVRGKELPKDVFNEALSYVIAHEVGHCLGLMHNMAASAAFPVDSLRSSTFTQKYGTTPSIMDYARFNYVAQPEDKGVALTPPILGAYDEFAIRWLYTPVYDVKDEWEEAQIASKWLDEKAGDPFYRYGKQQISGRYDPSALEEDLGDDPIGAGEYGIANLKYILVHLNEWIKDDEDMEYRRLIYNQIINQYCRYLLNAMYQVGGIYLIDAKECDGKNRFLPVERDKQKATVEWVLGQLRESYWLDNKDLLNKLPIRVSPSAQVAQAMGKLLFAFSSHVALSSSIVDNGYTQNEFFQDLFAGIWNRAIAGERLTQTDKVLQSLSLKVFSENLKPLGGNPLGFKTCTLGCDVYGEEAGYGYDWQSMVNTKLIDESQSYYLRMVESVKSLLEAKMNTFSEEDKPYYEAMLFAMRQLLGGQTKNK